MNSGFFSYFCCLASFMFVFSISRSWLRSWWVWRLWQETWSTIFWSVYHRVRRRGVCWWWRWWFVVWYSGGILRCRWRWFLSSRLLYPILEIVCGGFAWNGLFYIINRIGIKIGTNPQKVNYLNKGEVYWNEEKNKKFISIFSVGNSRF